ncbi:hypothetical protein AB5J52_01130 [Streptomyces sp. R39]|uniref:Uncharacterized protein n=1 Tax=Streptomyces sp. R39 TaxID=3238631 RepID=A0AB39QER9_9ACTN
MQSRTRTRIGPDGPLPSEDGGELDPTGHEFYPQAVGESIGHTWRTTGGIP